ncbi:Sugar transporter STL1 [Colletotrichum orbiculare MAFF 240422]|uniref:Sugar transporter STL1 n=1 Tax=Colletotrichum orbiculare (strain 104-T / ATCC 96160 / CBS 514.97 / LARS 414 / MAFF 240422) TaxID=1213857 RepID=A0A484FQK5_COLOR|nr:Sugar transporter STL1 [Colletotrichum orbiculare MAFF 240422]
MRLPELSGIPLRIVVFLTAGSAFLLFGYDQGVMGGLISLKSFLDRFGHPSDGLLGFMVASYDIGCLLGAAAAFLWGDIAGRRRAIVYSCIVLMCGAALQTAAFWIPMYIVGRIIAGIGIGSVSVTVPIYVSECARPSWRGILVVSETTVVILGICLSNFTNFGFVYGRPDLNGTEAQWRIPIGLQMIFPPLVFLMMPFTVESPRWLAARGRHSEVAQVLARLHGKGVTPDSHEIRKEAELIIQTARHEAEIESSWKESFTNGELQNLRRLILAGTTGFLHQATGINVVIYYSQNIFRQVGLDDRLSYIMSCVGSVCFLVGSILPVFYIERIGRRKVMMLGASTCGICMGIIACTGAVSLYYPERASASSWAGAAFILVFEFSFGTGWNSMNWLYSSEIGSLRMRNKTAATQCLCHWAMNFLTVMIAPTGFATLGWRFYLVWMAITLAAIPFLYCCFPETAGRTLEQMDGFFRLYPQWNIRKVANAWVEEGAISGNNSASSHTKNEGEKFHRQEKV